MSENLYWYYQIAIYQKGNNPTEDKILGSYFYHKEPTKEQIGKCIGIFYEHCEKDVYAELRKIASIEKRICVDEEPKAWLKASDIIHDNKKCLFFRIVDESKPDAIPYEGSMEDPKKRDWYFLVALVKIAARNGLTLSLYSEDENIDRWANDYLESYIGG